MDRRKIQAALLAAAMLLTIWTGCSDNPVTPSEDHFEARGVALRMNGIDTVVVDSNRVKQGRIVVKQGEETAHIDIQFIKEDGTRGVPSSAREDHTLGWDVADTTIATVLHEAEDGVWTLHLKGLKAGMTTLTVKLLHNNHPDFQSIPIPVEVTQ